MANREGQQLGNYRLIRLLGEGGFAEVYLGEHIHLGTQAAIKILHTQLFNEDSDKFRNEARTIANLVHPNIVRVLEFGIEGKTPFLVMDYAPNGTLRQRHPYGTVLPIETVVSYVKQIASALQNAHEQKLVHRDIKPENMLLGRRNEVLLSDFGIALVAQSSRYQSTQDVVGTVAYMSPEQIQGKPRPSSDQYSLAIVTYEWLSGDRPFHGSFTELCAQHMFATPSPLREKLPTLPGDVEQVVSTALNKDPHQRFMTVQAFANALEQASQPSQPHSSSRPSAQQPQRPASAPIAPTVYAPPPPPPFASYIPPAAYTPTPPQPSASYTPPPPPPPTPNQAAAFSNYGSSPSIPGPLGYNPYDANAKLMMAGQSGRKLNPWAIGKVQIIAAIVGVLFYGICDFALDKLFIGALSNSSFLTNTFYSFPIGTDANGTYFLYLSPSIFLVGLLFTSGLFFGEAFGPWVGVATIVVGGYLGDYLSQYLSNFSLSWNWYLGSAIFGFLAGLAFVMSKGRYTNIGTNIIAGLIGAGALIVGNGFYALTDTGVSHISAIIAWSEFLYNILPGLILAIVLLPIALTVYGKVTSNRG